MKATRKHNEEEYAEAESDGSDEAPSVNSKLPTAGYRVQPVQPTKSNDEILRRYEELLGERPSGPKVMEKQQSAPQQIQPKQYIPEDQASSSTPYISPRKLLDAPLDRIQELPSREADAPPSRSKRIYSRDALNEKEQPPKNLAKPPLDSVKQQQRKTNYSAEYEEGKPFSSKPPSSKKTIDQAKNEPAGVTKQQSRSSENQRKPSATNTTQNFKRRLEENVVRDKSEDKPVTTADKRMTRNSGKPVSSNKLYDEKVADLGTQKIKEELLELNYQETLLQSELRKIHMDNKERAASFYKKHGIRSGAGSVKELTGEDILVLDEPEEQPTPQKQLPKKLKFLADYQEYIDEVNLELRKVNYLLKAKLKSVADLEEHTFNDPLHAAIEEAISREEFEQNNSELAEAEPSELPKGKENEESQLEDPDQAEPAKQFSSYRELMKYRKNKAWQRKQRLNFDSNRTASQFDQQLVVPIQPSGEDRIETYEIDGVGKLKVNANLKNLLLS